MLVIDIFVFKFGRNSIFYFETAKTKMNGRKRGNYFQYLNNDENASLPKIPRQTLWNRKQKVIHCTRRRYTRSYQCCFYS